MSEMSEPNTAIREPGFYRILWRGKLAVGFLHTWDEPRAWNQDHLERWSVLFEDRHDIGCSAAYTATWDIPDDHIGERI